MLHFMDAGAFFEVKSSKTVWEKFKNPKLEWENNGFWKFKFLNLTNYYLAFVWFTNVNDSKIKKTLKRL